MNYIPYIQYGSIALSLALFTYWVVLSIQDWIDDNKLQEHMYQEAVNKYIAQQNEQIESLRDNLRQYMARELSLLNEQRIANGRIAFLGRELACDQDKKTCVLGR